MPRIRKRVAMAVARNFAVGLLENAQCSLLVATGLTDDELIEMQSELQRIAERIESTVNYDLLAQAGSLDDVTQRENELFLKS